MRLELDHDCIRRTDLALEAEDLRLGVSLGLISPRTAAFLAADIVASGAEDPTLHDVAQVDRNDAASVRETLRDRSR